MQRLIRVSKACTGNKRPEAIATLAAGVDGASRVRDQALPAWAEVAAAIQPLQLAMGPAELHGALCGWLAAGGANTADWLRSVMVDAELPQPAAGDTLDRLRVASTAQLDDPQFGFQLLLPEDENVAVRAAAVFEWCRGFLGGFGLVPREGKLTDEISEALQDMGNLAAAQVEEGDEDDDARDLAEIEEYLRVATLLVHADCARPTAPDRRLH